MEIVGAYHMRPHRSLSEDYSCPTRPCPDLLFDTVAIECDDLGCGSTQL
jgi:hypothetical protein